MKSFERGSEMKEKFIEKIHFLTIKCFFKISWLSDLKILQPHNKYLHILSSS